MSVSSKRVQEKGNPNKLGSKWSKKVPRLTPNDFEVAADGLDRKLADHLRKMGYRDIDLLFKMHEILNIKKQQEEARRGK